MAISSEGNKVCCPPKGNPEPSSSPRHSTVEITSKYAEEFDLSDIPGGIVLVGTNRPLIALDEESPVRKQTIEPFRMMQTAVTNAMFAAFVKDTAAEWEHAARGGLGDVPFPRGEKEPDDHAYHPCNIWQGQFPATNTCVDGHAATAPAQSFEPNGYGLYNMCGNVWEWTSGRLKITGRSTESKQHAKHYKGTKLLKGGSYLCHNSYCFRYRIAARTGSTPDSTTTHQGFRLVFS